MGTPKFRDAAALTERIDAYFARCEEEDRPPTRHGLALALGFSTPEAMARYRGKAQNREAIARGMTRLGQYAEERLLQSGGAGARYVMEQSRAAGLEDDDGAADVMAEVRRRLRRRGEA